MSKLQELRTRPSAWHQKQLEANSHAQAEAQGLRLQLDECTQKLNGAEGEQIGYERTRRSSMTKQGPQDQHRQAVACPAGDADEGAQGG